MKLRTKQAALRGAYLTHDSRQPDLVHAYDRGGRKLPPRGYNALIDKPWQWRLELTVVHRAGDVARVAEREWTTDQYLRLSELGFLVDDTTTEVGLEMPEAFILDHIEWKVTVL